MNATKTEIQAAIKNLRSVLAIKPAKRYAWATKKLTSVELAAITERCGGEHDGDSCSMCLTCTWKTAWKSPIDLVSALHELPVSNMTGDDFTVLTDALESFGFPVKLGSSNMVVVELFFSAEHCTHTQADTSWGRLPKLLTLLVEVEGQTLRYSRFNGGAWEVYTVKKGVETFVDYLPEAVGNKLFVMVVQTGFMLHYNREARQTVKFPEHAGARGIWLHPTQCRFRGPHACTECAIACHHYDQTH